MLNDALKSAGPVVIPLEVFQSANGVIAREANRFTSPFVSIENAPSRQQADAMILALTEYNYGFANAFKIRLEKNLATCTHRAVGTCDLSPGWLRP